MRLITVWWNGTHEAMIIRFDSVFYKLISNTIRKRRINKNHTDSLNQHTLCLTLPCAHCVSCTLYAPLLLLLLLLLFVYAFVRVFICMTIDWSVWSSEEIKREKKVAAYLNKWHHLNGCVCALIQCTNQMELMPLRCLIKMPKQSSASRFLFLLSWMAKIKWFGRAIWGLIELIAL